MLLNYCYCPYFRTILKYVHHFANIALGKHKGFKKEILQDYTNLFIFMENEKNITDNLFEITIKLMEMLINY